MTAIAYLSGYGEFEDRIEHIRAGRYYEYYVDEHKAIFRVAVVKDDQIIAWRERIFTQPVNRQSIRIQIAMLRMSDDVTDLGSQPIEDDGRQICPNCQGFGTKTDMDGDEMMCNWCEGVGWY